MICVHGHCIIIYLASKAHFRIESIFSIVYIVNINGLVGNMDIFIYF